MSRGAQLPPALLPPCQTRNRAGRHARASPPGSPGRAADDGQLPVTGTTHRLCRGHRLGRPHQEVWVSNKSNIGNWYTPDVPLRGDAHPQWRDVLRRAEGRTLTLLVTAGPGSYAAGYQAGADAIAAAVRETLDNLPQPSTAAPVRSPEPAPAPDSRPQAPAAHTRAQRLARAFRDAGYRAAPGGNHGVELHPDDAARALSALTAGPPEPDR